jgi:hypothetical protein
LTRNIGFEKYWCELFESIFWKTTLKSEHKSGFETHRARLEKISRIIGKLLLGGRQDLGSRDAEVVF